MADEEEKSLKVLCARLKSVDRVREDRPESAVFFCDNDRDMFPPKPSSSEEELD